MIGVVDGVFGIDKLTDIGRRQAQGCVAAAAVDDVASVLGVKLA